MMMLIKLINGRKHFGGKLIFLVETLDISPRSLMVKYIKEIKSKNLSFVFYLIIEMFCSKHTFKLIPGFYLLSKGIYLTFGKECTGKQYL